MNKHQVGSPTFFIGTIILSLLQQSVYFGCFTQEKTHIHTVEREIDTLIKS